MYLDDDIRKLTFFSSIPDITIFFKEYVYRTGQTHWHNNMRLKQDAISVICLCNWKYYRSSLRLRYSDNGVLRYKCTVQTVQPGHIHISVYSLTEPPTLTQLCKVYMSMYRFNTEFVCDRSYFTQDLLYSIRPMSLYLASRYGNCGVSCKHESHTLNTPPGFEHPVVFYVPRHLQWTQKWPDSVPIWGNSCHKLTCQSDKEQGRIINKFFIDKIGQDELTLHFTLIGTRVLT
jgi:hypothetical protein